MNLNHRRLETKFYYFEFGRKRIPILISTPPPLEFSSSCVVADQCTNTALTEGTKYAGLS